MKIFNYKLCLNISTIEIQTEMIPCSDNGILVYSGHVHNQISACDFSGYFKTLDEQSEDLSNGVTYHCSYIIQDHSIVTCDFVHLTAVKVATFGGKVCGIDFN